MKKKEKLMAIIGLVLAIGGIIGALSTSLNNFIPGLIISSLAAIIGIIITVYTFSG